MDVILKNIDDKNELKNILDNYDWTNYEKYTIKNQAGDDITEEFYKKSLDHGFEKDLIKIVKWVMGAPGDLYDSVAMEPKGLDIVTELGKYNRENLELYTDFVLNSDLEDETIQFDSLLDVINHYGWNEDTYRLYAIFMVNSSSMANDAYPLKSMVDSIHSEDEFKRLNQIFIEVAEDDGYKAKIKYINNQLESLGRDLGYIETPEEEVAKEDEIPGQYVHNLMSLIDEYKYNEFDVMAEKIDELLKSGFDINSPYNDGYGRIRTPLLGVILEYKFNPELFKLLIERGADINFIGYYTKDGEKIYSETPLTSLIKKCSAPDISGLQDYEIEREQKIWEGFFNALSYFIELKPNLKPTQGINPLSSAVCSGSLKVVELISNNYSYDLNEVTEGSDPILYTAIEFPDILDYLLKNGAYPSISGKNWNNPLDLACHMFYVDSVKTLVHNGVKSETALEVLEKSYKRFTPKDPNKSNPNSREYYKIKGMLC